MIEHPWEIIAILLLIEGFVIYISLQERFQRYFKFLPPIFWIYFLPMLASTVGLIDSHSPLYGKIILYFLPPSLFLLLIAVDLKAILRLGRPALIMMFGGIAGTMLGTVLVFFLLHSWVGPHRWGGFGAIAASWTGGSANMIAVKEAIGVPDDVFLPMVIVDTIVSYVWMGFLVMAAELQQAFDRWNRADKRIVADLARRSRIATTKKRTLRLRSTLVIFAVAFLGGIVSLLLAKMLPEIKDVISRFTWAVILVSAMGVACSFTPIRKLEEYGASRIGYVILYFVLASVGARANFTEVGSTLPLILAGLMIVTFHGLVMIGVARLIRAPMFLVAVASQANIGGVASAPIVAEIYRPGMASVGLLLAILGNILGTYLGIVTAHLCRWVAGL